MDDVSVLMGAAFGGPAEIVCELLDKGADINAQDDKGLTALMWTVKKENTDVIGFLRNAGCQD